MNNKLVSAIASIAVLGIIIAWMANLFEDRIEPGVLDTETQTSSVAYTVAEQQVPVLESVPGTLVAREATDISSRILARIEKIKVRSGDTVGKGDLLITLDSRDLQARKAQAEDRVNAVQARQQEAEQQLKRIDALYRQSQISRADYDRAVANATTLEAELSSARQALQESETTLGYSEIRAPISGRIIDRFAEPGDTATAGAKLLSLYNPLSLRVEAHVREGLALHLDLGDSVDVEIPTLNRHLPGTMEEIIPAANPGARSFQVHVVLEYLPEVLPGMFARLQFQTGEEARLLIPFSLVSQVGQLDIVGVVESGKTSRRIIKTGRRHDDEIEVLAGLEPGEQLVALQPVP